jgi:GxxExxY protein
MMLQEKELSYVVRGCVYEVFKELGAGFLEKVYENALLTELRLQGLSANAQVPIKVQYKGTVVGEYFADLVIEESIILELKAQQQLSVSAEAQLLNYLKAGDKKIGMLVNFAHPRATIRRFII